MCCIPSVITILHSLLLFIATIPTHVGIISMQLNGLLDGTQQPPQMARHHTFQLKHQTVPEWRQMISVEFSHLTHSSFYCVVTGHAFIGEYVQRFFPQHTLDQITCQCAEPYKPQSMSSCTAQNTMPHTTNSSWMEAALEPSHSTLKIRSTSKSFSDPRGDWNLLHSTYMITSVPHCTYCGIKIWIKTMSANKENITITF